MHACQRVRLISIVGLMLGFSLSGSAQTGGTISASPASLDLDNTSGPVVTRTVVLSTTSTTSISFQVSLGNVSWLTVTPSSGTVVAGHTLTLTLVADATNLSLNSTYNVNVPIVYGSSTLSIPVNFTVESVSGITANPPSTSWVYAPGGASPATQAITLTTSAATFTAVVAAGSPWLLLGVPNPTANFVPQSQLNSYPTAAGFTLVFNSGAALTAGTTYTAYITVTDSNNSMTLMTVSLSVLGQGSSFTVSPPTVTLTTSTTAVTTPVTFYATNPTSFTATATVTSPVGGTWLSVAPTSGTASQTVTVTADPTGLAAGTYTGIVTGVAGTLSAILQVTFVVSTGAAGGGNVNTDHTAITASYQVGGTAPASQAVVISNKTSSSTSIPFTVSAVVFSGTTTWLSVAVQGGGTQGYTGATSATVLVNFSPQGLAAGSYTGAVYITPVGGNVLGIPVTLTVQAAGSLTVSPSQLTFSYQVGAAVPATQPVQVTGSVPSLTFTVATATTPTGNWLSTSATNGITPATLTVSVAPAGLNAGSYTGTITLTGTGTATGTATISVTLTVSAALPSITSVQNAASFGSGAVSPGELVSIFGTTLGPSTPVGTAIDSTGKVATNIGNVQVLFSGTAAPLTYVSSTQINCVVPYEITAVSGTPYVQVKYLGQGSNTYNLTTASTSPGIFATSAGKGQGAILNADNTYNSSSNPAAKGSTVQLYMTGEGPISPQAATGAVTCSAGCTTTAQIPKPTLALAALVNGQPATIAYFGEAAGDVSGVLQVNVTIPPGTPSGAVPIVISIGPNSSQAGVTVAVQ